MSRSVASRSDGPLQVPRRQVVRMQGPGPGMRVAGQVVPGGVIRVEVGGAGSTVEVNTGAPGQMTSHPVGPDRTATITIPNVPGGTVLCLCCGRGLSGRYLLIEVVEP